MYKIALIIAGKVTDYFNEFSDRIQVYNVTSTPEALDLAHKLESSNSAEAIVAPTFKTGCFRFWGTNIDTTFALLFTLVLNRALPQFSVI